MKGLLVSLILALIAGVDAYAETYRVEASSLNIRDNASQDGAVIGQLGRDELVEVQSIDNGWALIDRDGCQGYVKASYLAVTDDSESAPTEDKEGIIHKCLSIFSNDGEATWFTIVKWILIILALSVLLRYGLALLVRMIGYGMGIGGAGLVLGGLLYWFDWIEEWVVWRMGTYGFYIGCGLAVIYLLFNLREWSDDASTILKRSSSPASETGPDGLRRYSVIDDYGTRYNLTQRSKYSLCDYVDQDGRYWVHDSSGFHRV